MVPRGRADPSVVSPGADRAPVDMEFEGTKGNEGSDPFGMRSAMQRKMRERGDDPASRARAEAEARADAEVSDAEIAELLDPDSPDTREDTPGA